MADPNTHELDEALDFELFSGDHEINPEQEETHIGFYSDGHIEIKGVVYEIDDISELILKRLRNADEFVEQRRITDELFGGYKGYENPSAAQMASFIAALEYLAAVEAETGAAIYELHEIEGEVYLEPRFRHTFLRKPFSAKEESERKDSDIQEAHNGPEVLDDDSIKLLSYFIEHTDEGDDLSALSAKDVFMQFTGTQNPSFEQEADFMQYVNRLNDWLQDKEVNIRIVRGASMQGPVFRLQSEVFHDEITSLISEINAEIVAEHEESTTDATSSTEEAEPSSSPSIQARKADSTKAIPKRPRKDASKNTAQGINRYIVGNVPLAYRRAPLASELDKLRTSAMRGGLDPELVIGARTAIPVLTERARKRIPHEVDTATISFLHEAATMGAHRDGSPLSRLTEASFNALTYRYAPMIVQIARKLSYSSGVGSSYESDLVVTGLEGFREAVDRYDPDGGSAFTNYCRVRVHGSMVDYLREMFGRRGRLRPLSLDGPASQIYGRGEGDTGDGLSLLGALETSDPEAESILASVELSKDDVIASLRRAFVGLRSAESGRTITERDKEITLLYFGITSLMSPELYENYLHLLEIHKTTTITKNMLAAAYGVTESRISQATSRVHKALAVVLSDQRDILYPA